jgi:hypothetical protein
METRTSEDNGMTMTTTTLTVPGAELTYDVRPNESSTEPVLLLIGSPMGPPVSSAWRRTSATAPL